ncbi:thioredoxin domain-containing protein, partial [Thermocrinis sp.]
MNKLKNSKSPYLRKSAHQPVHWYEWSQEAFRKAKEEDKPVLLSIGGVWCHWCHVMAHESFENEEIAKIINEHFIAIKVDRDERPDIDRRYQEVVVALTGAGGWPLTVFLTPEGEAFFGGTYFPPEDRWGRPGFKSLLLRIAQLWKEDRQRITNSGKQLYQAMELYSRRSYKGEVGEELLDRGINSILLSTDYQYGGIGDAPKFHHAKAWELLLYRYFFTKNPQLLKVVELSLDAMAKGGVYDHLLGGFFRYSTDQRWIVPHFEKMLYDNAELLQLYSMAYQLIPKELYKNIAEGIVEYYKREGTDPQGGFYASQDADIGLLDEGGYYTFSLRELEELLSAEELQVARLYYGMQQMHHDPSKNVLYIAMEEKEVANTLSIPEEEVKRIIQSIKTELLRYREEKREKPYIDKTIYANWNGLMLEAMAYYYKVFKDQWAKDFSIKTAQRVMDELYKGGELEHTHGVNGFSEDYIFMARGLLSLFEITQEQKWLDLSVELTLKAIEKFWDSQNWGFFDSEEEGEGLLKLRIKNLADTPT